MKLRVLLSYWYYKDTDLDELFATYFIPPYPDVFADSGAFSAMTQGISIQPQEYAAWVKRWQHLFSVYANLDVIRDAEASWRNQHILEDLGIQPLPAFHVMEDFSWLEKYVDRYPYIALGVAGMQGRRDAVMRWLIRCFEIAGNQSVFHGFGLTSWSVMSSFPWYSVDSTSWSSGFRFGQVPLFDSRRGRFEDIKLGDIKTCRKWAHLIREEGFDPLDFVDRTRNDRAKICAISALSFMKAEQYLRSRWGEIRIPDRENTSDGMKLHLCTWPPEIKSGETSQFVGGDIQWDAIGDLQKDIPPHQIRMHPRLPTDGGLKLHLAGITPGSDLGGVGDGQEKARSLGL